ncbi:MAG: 2-keto-4-pentenoate hydratase, partial [Rhodospirillales bacterium]
MNAKLEKLAAALAAAWRDYATIPLPAAADAPASRAEAYAVQDRIAELVGERVVGWKVGAAIAAVQRLEGHDGAIPGRLFASRIFHSPATVPGDRFAGHRVECEYAFRFTRDLPANRPKFTPQSIVEVMDFHPAIELASSRYAPGTGGRSPRTHDAIADNGSGGAFVFGPAIPNWRKAVDFDKLPIEPRIDGGAPLRVYTGELRRNPVEIAAETVNDLAARGVAFKAGDYLSTGSLSL